MMIVAGLCSVQIIILIFVAIFGDYGAVMVEDKERPVSRNVCWVISTTVAVLSKLGGWVGGGGGGVVDDNVALGSGYGRARDISLPAQSIRTVAFY